MLIICETAELLVVNFNRISAVLTRKLLSVIDNITVDVLKIVCCSQPTGSFMVNVTVAQLLGHNFFLNLIPPRQTI